MTKFRRPRLNKIVKDLEPKKRGRKKGQVEQRIKYKLEHNDITYNCKTLEEMGKICDKSIGCIKRLLDGTIKFKKPRTMNLMKIKIERINKII